MADVSGDRVASADLAGAMRIRRTIEATGHLWTKQRAAVIAALREAPAPLDAEELYARARQRAPRVSRSTVQRTLDILREHGLVREWEHAGSGTTAAYSGHPLAPTPSTQARLVCQRCGKRVDVRSAVLPRLLRDLQRRYRFRLGDASLELTAQCAACAA